MHFNLLINNAKIYNTAYKKFYDGFITILGDKIYHATKGTADEKITADKVIDAEGKYVIPGLVDVHMHIESSMLTPEPFARIMAEYGVTTIVAEPHEIANVAGIDGISAMMLADKGADIDIFYGISSSVPSTSEELETTGGIIALEELKGLIDNPKVVCLGEIMNSSSVINDDNSMANKFIEYIKQHRPSLAIEGHCPSLIGDDLTRYVYKGIDSDHTEHDLEGAIQRLHNGVQLQLQHKTMKPEIVQHIIENNLYESVALVTDDVAANILATSGHLNNNVKKAIELGFSPEHAIYCATHTPARRMNFRDRGELRPGMLADMVILDELAGFKVRSTYKNGKEIYNCCSPKEYESVSMQKKFPEEYYHTVKLEKLCEDDFVIKHDRPSACCRVMGISSTTTQTSEGEVVLPVKDGKVNWEKSGVMLICVFERYGKNHNKGYGFANGDTIKRGAVATTYAHDHHNLMVIGENVSDMLIAANRVIELQGGMVVVENAKVIAEVALPVGGIMSEMEVKPFGVLLSKVSDSMKYLGYIHNYPIMSFATNSLPVSPKLKISDVGLIDVVSGKIVSLIK